MMHCRYFDTTRNGNHSSSITTNIKSTTGFPRARDGVRTLPLSVLKGGSKSDFFAFQYKSTADRLKHCQLSSPVSVINIWWSATMLIASSSTPYSAARLSRRNYLISIWCGSVSGSRDTCEKPLKEWLPVPLFTCAFLKLPSSRCLSAIAGLLVLTSLSATVTTFTFATAVTVSSLWYVNGTFLVNWQTAGQHQKLLHAATRCVSEKLRYRDCLQLVMWPSCEMSFWPVSISYSPLSVPFAVACQHSTPQSQYSFVYFIWQVPLLLSSQVSLTAKADAIKPTRQLVSHLSTSPINNSGFFDN